MSFWNYQLWDDTIKTNGCVLIVLEVVDYAVKYVCVRIKMFVIAVSSFTNERHAIEQRYKNAETIKHNQHGPY